MAGALTEVWVDRVAVVAGEPAIVVGDAGVPDPTRRSVVGVACGGCGCTVGEFRHEPRRMPADVYFVTTSGGRLDA